jgi:hypothetical protein
MLASVAQLFHNVFPEVMHNASDLADARLAQTYSVITPHD